MYYFYLDTIPLERWGTLKWYILKKTHSYLQTSLTIDKVALGIL